MTRFLCWMSVEFMSEQADPLVGGPLRARARPGVGKCDNFSMREASVQLFGDATVFVPVLEMHSSVSVSRLTSSSLPHVSLSAPTMEASCFVLFLRTID